jgi:hypothetical protein
MVREPVQVCVVGDDHAARELEAAALAGYAVNKSVVRLKRVQRGMLPPVLEKTLPRLPKVEGSFAVVCSGSVCHGPVMGVGELGKLL